MRAEFARLASLGSIEFAPSAKGHAVAKVTRDGLAAMLRRLAGKQAGFHEPEVDGVCFLA